MIVFFVFLGFSVAFINAENKERKASLLVLPPLVLGYEELYADAMARSSENRGADQTRQHGVNPKAERENTENTDTKTQGNGTKDDEEFSDDLSDEFTDEMSIEVNDLSYNVKGDKVEKAQRRSKRSVQETPCPCQQG